MRRTVTLVCMVAAVACGNDSATNEGVLRSGLTKGNGGVSGVDTNFCDDPANPCVTGEADCDTDAQCEGVLVCGIDNGPQFGFGNLWDVCVPEHCRNGVQDEDETFVDCGGVDCGSICGPVCDLPASPAAGACSEDCPCDAGESDCNTDADCAGALVCGVNNGDQFGFETNFDVCVAAHCRNGVLDADETSVDCGGADCGPNCGADCGGRPAPGADNYCTNTCWCLPQEGDCDSDAQCVPGSICVDNVGPAFGFTKNTDVCLADHCVNDVQDGDETGVDCGPSCLPCLGDAVYVEDHGLTGNMNLMGAAIDSAGSVVVSGHFFDDTNLGGSTFSRVGGSTTTTDIFIAKYDPSGAHLWSQQFASDASDGNLASVVAVGPGGEVALAGNFNRTVDFGSGFVLTAAGRVDAFVVLLEADGTTRWARGFGGTEIDSAYDVAFNSTGDVFVTGSFELSADFGGGEVTAAGGSDIFVARLAGSTGATVASATFGGTGADVGYAVTTQGARLYVGGAFRDSIAFGSLSGTAAGATDAFVVELGSSSLAPLRARFFGGSNVDRVTSIDVDPALNVTAAGIFGSSVDFGLGAVTAVGGVDAFVVGLSGTLVSRWVQTFGGTANDEARGVAVDDLSGRVFVTGTVQDTVANFPGGSSDGLGGRDSFRVIFASDGTLVSSARDGGAGNDVGQGVAIAGASYVYAGNFNATATIAGAPVTSGGGQNIFVGRFAL